MTRIVKTQKLNLIHKRFFDTQTRPKIRNRTNVQPPITTTTTTTTSDTQQATQATSSPAMDANLDKQEVQEGQQVAVPLTADGKGTVVSPPPDKTEVEKAAERKAERKAEELEAEDLERVRLNNTVMDDNVFPEQPQVAEYVFFTKQGQRNMNIIKGITANVLVVAEKLEKTVKQSDELRVAVEKIVRNVDEMEAEFQKQTSGWWKQKWFTYSASTVTILFVVYQMFQYKAVPNFLGIIGEAGIAFLKGSKEVAKENIKDIPKPSAETTIKAIMETPVAPLTILTAVGTLTVAIMALKVVSFVLRKVPK